MSEKDQTQENSTPTQKDLKSGEEPTELLLQLAWSPIETLANRSLARVFVGNGAVMILLEGVTYHESFGLVPTVPESVGNQEMGIGAVGKTGSLELEAE